MSNSKNQAAAPIVPATSHALLRGQSHAIDESVTNRWPLSRILACIQGTYFLVTGVWPLMSIHTFQAVTGPKTDHLVTGLEGDHWLVMTVAVLVVGIGLTLLCAGWRGTKSMEIAVLAIASAAGLAAIDLIYVSRQVIAPIYLLDAAVEAALIIGWCIALVSQRISETSAREV